MNKPILFLLTFNLLSFVLAPAVAETNSELKLEQENVLVAQEKQAPCQCDESNINVTERYATLKQREIGSPLLDENGERVIWPRVLPFFAQNVLDLGFELPKTFGLAIIPNVIAQDLTLTDLKVGLNGSEMVDMDFVQFGSARADNSNLQIKADVWLFPFLNLYATYGKMNGSAATPISIEGKDLIEFLGGSCGGVLSPKACDKTLTSIAVPEYHGSNVSLGFTLAMGWDRFFVALPVTYVVTDLNILEDNVKAFQVSPRIGLSSDAGDLGTMSTFFGFSYLHAELDVAGKLSFDTSDLPGGIPTTELDFIINQENTDKINYLIGFNWDVSKTWSFHSEAGFGGTRESFIASATYRF
ncbi:MAG: hypothetical protein ACPGTQ_05385 [Colwellia sp.]